MARGGVYKTEVQKARDSLLAQGVNPSLDAVRIALGNTGSKSTIHRYMKELEAEETKGRGEPISEALAHLVAQLADRLRLEADERVAQAQAACDTVMAEARAAQAEQVKEGRALSDQLQRTETRLRDECEAHAGTLATLRQAQTQIVALEERVTGLEARLSEREAHSQSLEAKHQQAREALDHFRQSAREQREAELQRYEHQLQSLQIELRHAQDLTTVKNQELLQLNRDNARLTEQNAEREKVMRQLQRQYDQILPLTKELPALKREAETVGRNWVEANAELEQLRGELVRREAGWEAERAAWQEERGEHVRHDDRLQAIETLLADLKPNVEPQPRVSR